MSDFFERLAVENCNVIAAQAHQSLTRPVVEVFVDQLTRNTKELTELGLRYLEVDRLVRSSVSIDLREIGEAFGQPGRAAEEELVLDQIADPA